MEKVLGQSRPQSLLIGHLQDYRSDDYRVALPTQISQSLIGFKTLNPTLIPNGFNTLILPINVLNDHWSSLFKPGTWGYLISPDFGLSWEWNIGLLSLFVALFLLLGLWELNVKARALLSLGFVMSPVLSLWAFNSVWIWSAGLLSLYAFYKLSSAHNTQERALSLVAFVFFSVSAAIHLYPPYQITLLYLLLTLGSVFLFWNFKKNKKNFPAVLLGIFICVLLLALYLQQSKEIISLMSQTVYPGKRRSFSDDSPWPIIFTGNFFMHLKTAWRNGAENTSECARNFLFLPWLLPFFIYSWKKQASLLKTVQICLLSLIFVCLLKWAGLIPSTLQSLLGLDRVPSPRTIILICLCDFFLLAHFISLKKIKIKNENTYLFWSITTAFLIVMAVLLSRIAPTIKVSHFVIVFIFSFFLIWTLFFKVKHFPSLFLIFNVVISLPFIPLSRKTFSAIKNDPISQEVLRVQKQDPGAWMVCGEPSLASYLRMLGLPSMGGVQFYPQFSLWKILDPGSHDMGIYNRYAFLDFELKSMPTNKVDISLPFTDLVRVGLSPNNTALKNLNVKYVLAQQKQCPQKAILNGAFKKISTIKDFEIYLRQ